MLREGRVALCYLASYLNGQSKNSAFPAHSLKVHLLHQNQTDIVHFANMLSPRDFFVRYLFQSIKFISLTFNHK